jgi:hypothetical protein
VFVNLGHRSLNLLLGLLKEIENGCGLVAALLYKMLWLPSAKQKNNVPILRTVHLEALSKSG